ncbi:piggyBac transposable element-derived protein 4-like [Hylaeus anthracinus]|uniref:piggyBac transposable element-derived protein 4-like n=1 Tax=Hylaeus anthracinus TaxID=313031 RepID=UPI0023B932A0|nr:piggyBac transposable element-derived protein 4-like [Hylaeus anthracinus]
MDKPGPSMCQIVYSDESEDSVLENDTKRQKVSVTVYDSDDIEINWHKNRYKNYLETDDEDGELISEEIDVSESSIESESIEVNEFLEDSTDDREWMLQDKLKTFVFKQNNGLKYSPNGLDPINFFELLFDTNFFLNTVIETNKYGKTRGGDQWKELTVRELKIFLGLLLHMGTIKCPKLQNYWSTQRLFNFTCFSQHMSRNRFQEILRSLHFSSDNRPNNCMNKIEPIIDYFNEKMKQLYYPQKELIIHETLVPWRGRLDNISRKMHNCIKLYVLTEGSGITLRIKTYKGNNDDTNGTKYAAKIVGYLLEDFLYKGHSVYMDDFFTNFELAKQLLDAQTYCTGTLRNFRKGNNINVVNKKLVEGEMISRHKNNIIMSKFRNKREVLFISSEFVADFIELENKRKKKYKEPLALHKYNAFMENIDKKDQLLSYYTCIRNTFERNIKLWINIVETLLLNSFFLYSKYSSSKKKIHFFDYRLNIINAFLYSNNQENIPLALIQHEHLPEMLSRDEQNRIKRKRCRQCFANGSRKNTNYFCSGCMDNPGLCLGECFKEYHKRLL